MLGYNYHMDEWIEFNYLHYKWFAVAVLYTPKMSISMVSQPRFFDNKIRFSGM